MVNTSHEKKNIYSTETKLLHSLVIRLNIGVSTYTRKVKFTDILSFKINKKNL